MDEVVPGQRSVHAPLSVTKPSLDDCDLFLQVLTQAGDDRAFSTLRGHERRLHLHLAVGRADRRIGVDGIGGAAIGAGRPKPVGVVVGEEAEA